MNKEMDKAFNEIEDNFRTSILHWNSFIISAEDWRELKRGYVYEDKNGGIKDGKEKFFDKM